MAYSSKREITIKKLFDIQTRGMSTPPPPPKRASLVDWRELDVSNPTWSVSETFCFLNLLFLHYQEVIKIYFYNLGIINKLF